MIFSRIYSEALLELQAVKLGAAVETPQQERQRLAEVAEHQSAAREAVEMPAEHEPQRVRAGLEAPSPCGPHQPLWPDRRGARSGRSDAYRSAPRGLRPVPRTGVGTDVEVLAVGMAVDHGATKLEFSHAAFEFVGGRQGVLHRQVGKAGIAVGPLLDFAGEKVVRLGGRRRAVETSRSLCTPGPAIARTDRAIPACPCIQGASRRNRSGATGDSSRLWGRLPDGRSPVVLEAGRQEMLFKRDLVDHVFLGRFCWSDFRAENLT